MPNIFGITRRAKPSTGADGAAQEVRVGRYGEQYVLDMTEGTYPLADEGSYFKVTNPTPSTGITASITTAFSATAAFMTIFNGDSAGGKRIYLDYLSLIPVTVPASATSLQMAITIDSIQRYSSGGSALTAVNPNMDDGTAAVAVIHAGAVVAAAASASRLLSRGVLRSAIPVLQDQLTVNFGGFQSSPGTLGGATALAAVDEAGPVIIGPGHTAIFHMWAPANATTAGVYELELGWFER